MKKKVLLFLVLTMIVSYLFKPMGLANAEPRAIQVTDEHAIEGTFAEPIQPIEETVVDFNRFWHVPLPVIAEGQFSDREDGLVGAEWILNGEGVLEVNAGFINWMDFRSPWHDYRFHITEINFAGSITAGMFLLSLFKT